MGASLATLAELVGGELVGPRSLEVESAATLSDARPGDITLVDRNEKLHKLVASGAAAAIVPQGFPADNPPIPLIIVEDVHEAFAAIVCYFHPRRPRTRIGISPSAVISPSARLAADVDVYPGVGIGDDVVIGRGTTIHAGVQIMAGCVIGEAVTIYPNAVFYENTKIGDRSIIHAGVVLGCHGFGYRFFEGSHKPSAQLGNVEVGADVEIGAGTTVDRGTYGATSIGDGTKIDNLVMIAHNVRVGRHNMICSQGGIAGSSTTGDYVVMAGQVGIRDHVRIGTGAVLGAMAGVTHDVPDGAYMFGIPATPEREQKIKQAAFAKLPEMRRQLKALQQTVERLSRGDDARGDDARDNQAA